MNGMKCGTVSFTAWDVLQKGIDVSIAIADPEAHRDLQYLHANGVPCGLCGSAPLSALRRLVRSAEPVGFE
jgi:diaminopropionate ammonia-lyase